MNEKKLYVACAFCWRPNGHVPEIGYILGSMLAEEPDIVITAIINECRRKFPVANGFCGHQASVVEIEPEAINNAGYFKPDQSLFSDSDFQAFLLEESPKQA